MDKFKFYPMRFRATRPFSKQLLERIKELQSSGKLNYQVAYETASSFIFQALRKDGVKINHSDLNSEFARLFSLQNMETLAWAQWSLSEAQLYCFNNELIEAFRHSSALDLTINNLKFPFENSYFYFGTQADMPLNDGELLVDGAYVFYSAVSLRIILTGQWQEDLVHKAPKHWFERGTECYDLRILSESYDLPLDEAIKKALEYDIEDLKKADETLRLSINITSSVRATQKFIDAHTSNQESYKKALSLISNALCYITAYSHDQKVMWEENAPSSLVNKTRSEKLKEKARATSKLKSMGFSIINQIGTEFGESRKRVDEHRSDTSSNIRTHWRRGHWRMQAYGEARSLRKLMWITPTRVGVTLSDDVSRIRQIH